MRLTGTVQRLTVYCGESDRYRHHPLAQAIIERARDEGLAGATMLRGVEGFGASSRLHTTRILSLSDDLPIVIEIVDRADRIAAFAPIVDEMMHGGLVTIEDLGVWMYRAAPPPATGEEDGDGEFPDRGSPDRSPLG
jgi:PII-like signaling protein